MKWTILLIIIFGRITCMDAQYVKQISLPLDSGVFEITRLHDGLHRIDVGSTDYFFKDIETHPALPYRIVSVLVPNSAELIDFTIEYDKELVQKDILLIPNPSIRAIPGPDERYAIDRFKGEIRGSYPENIIEYNCLQVMRGYTLLYFTFSPFSYDGGQKALFSNNNLSLTITYRLNELHKRPFQPDNVSTEIIRQRVVNPGDIDFFYPGKDISRLKSSEKEVDYLIITAHELIDEFQPLLEWKFRKGLKTEIISVEYIYSMYDDPTHQLKIKRYLYDKYRNHNIKWVLLGGDHTIIPVQYCFGKIGMDSEDKFIPTDLFYACFDHKFDWNSLKDDKIGEPYMDAHDVLPEIYISRIPVRNKDDVKVFVNKTLNYEKNPTKELIFEKMLLTGVKSWYTWNNMSDNHLLSEYMYSKHIANRWIGKKYGYYDTGTDFPAGENYHVSAVNLSSQLNDGYGFFHFAGHGNNNSYTMETGPSFTIKEASELAGSGLGIMLSTSCEVNAFDSPDTCLSEAFLRNPDGGCVAFFGSSRYGLGSNDKSEYLGPSFQINARFFELLFSEHTKAGANSFATIANSAKINFIGHGNSGVDHFWYLLYAINPMGDPELPLYNKNPDEFNDLRIYHWGNSLTVSTGGIPGCRICVSGTDPGIEYYQVANEVSSHSFYDFPVPCQVVITKPGYIPHTYNLGLTTDINGDISSFIRIYPNPASDLFNIDFKLPKGMLYIMDLRGCLLMTRELSEGLHTIPLETFQESLYILKIHTPKGVGQFKLLK